jgi:alkylhydroperoxidase family enzyme
MLAGPGDGVRKVVELVVVIATANWTNRFNDGLQTPPG